MLGIWLVLLGCIFPAGCRYLATEEPETVLPKYSPYPDATAEQDVDLEQISNDYYDEMLKELEKELDKLTVDDDDAMDYDYLSDMAEPEGDPQAPEAVQDGNFTGADSNASTSDDSHPVFQKVNRERSKTLRLSTILSQVLTLRGEAANGTSIPSTRQFESLREMYEQNIKRLSEWSHTSTYTEKVQSFYPSCDIPRNTDEEAWSESNAMNILFELTYPSHRNGTTISIVSAKLRLYKLSQGNYTLQIQEPCTPSFQVKPEKSTLALHNFGFLPSPGAATIDDDRQIRVSVYWYTKSLKKNRAKRKLLDSQMFSVYGEEWTEFNIRTAVRTWRESGKNFGLMVTVEDEDGSLLKADQYVHAMNCSKLTATVRPIPSIFMEAAKSYMMERSSSVNDTQTRPEEPEVEKPLFSYQSLPYPMLDLCTVEVPDSEARTVAFETQLLSLTKKRHNVGPPTNLTFVHKKNDELKNEPNATRAERLRKQEPRKAETDVTQEPTPGVNYFHNVALGSPSAGQNRNFLVPIITKSELHLADPSEVNMKELMRMQSDGASLRLEDAGTVRPRERRRHGRRQHVERTSHRP